jgi:hypothetical protein
VTAKKSKKSKKARKQESKKARERASEQGGLCIYSAILC